ncbi:MAG TPA: dienelactone hydrolase family protein [Trebonia sp.]|jgi:carboxymethylenebutenolidase|nr:dienelactone hydrolase family protein [Trebonia sp.]
MTIMPRLDAEIPAPDGTAAGTLHVPDGDGPWPGVIMFPDAFGLRETMRGMADKVAALGYVVLVPDVYYREAGWAPFAADAFGDDSERGRLFALMGSLTNDRIAADATAYADFLLARPEVRGPGVGTTGYCMGGRISLVTAGALGGKVAAAASFHGGGIAKADNESSPHHQAAQIRAVVYAAGAIEDKSFTEQDADLLRTALTGAGVTNTVEFYPAHHGFAVPDNPTYDEAAATRHYAALAALYGSAL